MDRNRIPQPNAVALSSRLALTPPDMLKVLWGEEDDAPYLTQGPKEYGIILISLVILGVFFCLML